MSYEAPTYETLSHERLATQTTTYGLDEGIMLPPEVLAYYEKHFKQEIAYLRQKIKDDAEIIAKKNAVIADQQTDIFDLKTENKTLKAKVDKYETDNSQAATDDFVYLIDPRQFKDVDKLWVKRFWAKMYELTNKTSANGSPIIYTTQQVAIILRVLQKHTKHSFTGSISDFAYYWNGNIASRICDLDLKSKLTVKEKSLTAALNKPLLRDHLQSEWHTLSLEGGPDADKFQMMDKLKILINDIIEKATIE